MDERGTLCPPSRGIGRITRSIRWLLCESERQPRQAIRPAGPGFFRTHLYETHQAMKILISWGCLAFRFDANTSIFPSGEKTEKALKPPAKVIRSRFLPLRPTL